ncbi:MAG: DUF547 domain-containing protein [Pseudomonadota bacterium]
MRLSLQFSRLGRVAAVLGMLLVLPGLGGVERLFAPKAELWPRWEAHDATSPRTIDHGLWGKFLSAHVIEDRNGPNLVSYAAVSPAESSALDQYLGAMAAVPISAFSRGEQMAYWVNLYNALTVRVILDHPAAESIRDIDISPGLFSDGPWDKKLIEVEGEQLSLNDIEHRILRPIWKDPRIHYAVNCASIGCPDLQAQPFTGAALNAQLEAAARAYVNDQRGVTVVGDEIIVSKIYGWFIEDFGDDQTGVLAHLQRYAEPELKKELSRIGEIADVAYDWSLNGGSR